MSGSRRQDIQGLRALAVMVVVLFHTGLLRGGFIGVDVFLVISGFVISLGLLNNLETTNTGGLARFYAARIRRLLPALTLMVAVVALIGPIALSPLGPLRLSLSTARWAVLSMANIWLYRSADGYFAPSADTNAFLHTWSLSVEEQFYLVFPLVLVIAWRIGRRIGRPRLVVTVTLSMAAVASFALSVWLTSGHNLPGLQNSARLAFYSPPTRAFEFLAGVLIALGAHRLRGLNERTANRLAVCSLMALGAGCVIFSGRTPWPGVATLVPLLASVGLIVAGAQRPKTLRFLEHPLMVRIGDLSYGWYLWHWPMIVVARIITDGNRLWMAVAALAALLPAWISYEFVECPVRRHRAIAGRRVIPFTTACIALPSLLMFVVPMAADRMVLRGASATIGTDTGLHLDQTLGCDTGGPLGQGPAACTTRGPKTDANAVMRVVLIGDSAAGQLSEPMVAAVTNAGNSLTIATRHACPFVTLEFVTSPRDEECANFVTRSLEVLEQSPPDLIIIGTASSGYINEDAAVLRDPVTGAIASTPESKARLWAASTRQMLRRLSAKSRVAVLLPVPRFEGWDIKSCPSLRLANDAMSCGRTVSRVEAEAERHLAVDATRIAISGIPNASLLDLFDDVCDANVCQTNDGYTFLFNDRSHLSPAGALRATKRLTDLVVGDS